MNKIFLRKIKYGDKKYFARWWRDKTLLKLTSGILKRISDKEVDGYFQAILKDKNGHNFVIVLGKKAIGHISLAKRKSNWHETQIIIGEKKYWSMGYGTKAIKMLIKKAEEFRISRIYLEVRPTNTRAIRVYEKCGFQKTKMVFYPKNKYLPKTLRMELR